MHFYSQSQHFNCRSWVERRIRGGPVIADIENNGRVTQERDLQFTTTSSVFLKQFLGKPELSIFILTKNFHRLNKKDEF